MPSADPVDAPEPDREAVRPRTAPKGTSGVSADVTKRLRPRDGRRFSRLTLRVMALSIFPVATIFGGLMYVRAYERSLIETEVTGLGTQARMIAGALGESTIPSGLPDEKTLNVTLAQNVIRRMLRPTRVRARLFGRDGKLVADSRALLRPGGAIRQEELPSLAGRGWVLTKLNQFYDWFFYLLAKGRDETPVYYEKPYESATDYPEVQRALLGDAKGYVRRTQDGYLVLSHAVPVQRYKTVFGALMLSMSSAEIDENVRSVRQDIVQVFAVVLFFTVLLSLYLARTIAAPINKLAATADAMRRGKPRSVVIPTFIDRRDEIGDLSAALHDLTNDLWDRMDAIERFAADVAHEIKNPLSSLRSAVETAAKVKDPEKQRKLMAVIEQDVKRLDRLITDISRASRIDAEMSRVNVEPVDLRKLLETFVDIHETTREGTGGARLELKLAPRGALTVRGHDDRLVQVFGNLVSNAESFSPPDGVITISATPSKDRVLVMIEDRGPGIPESKLADIFQRFYTERPSGEAFGQHSGLGLSISKQIIEALGGTITAENVYGADGKVRGARFLIALNRA